MGKTQIQMKITFHTLIRKIKIYPTRFLKSTKKQFIRTLPRDREIANKIGGRDVTAPDFWENETVGRITPVIAGIGIGLILYVLIDLSTSFFTATRDSFPISAR